MPGKGCPGHRAAALEGAGAGDAEAVRLVDEQHGVVLLGQGQQAGERGFVAQDAVEGFDGDQCARFRPVGQQPAGVLHAVVGERFGAGAAEPETVDHRGVAVFIRDDQGPGAAERRDHTDVGQIAGGEHQRRLHPGQHGQFLLEVQMQPGGSGHQARGRGARAPQRRGRRSCLGNPRVRREAQVVVAGQVDELFVRGAGERAADQAPAVPDRGLPLEPLGHRGAHAAPPRRRAGTRSWTSATAAVMPAVICSMSAAVLMYGGMV